MMFGLIKKIFIGLLTGLVNGSNHTKCLQLDSNPQPLSSQANTQPMVECSFTN